MTSAMHRMPKPTLGYKHMFKAYPNPHNVSYDTYKLVIRLFNMTLRKKVIEGNYYRLLHAIGFIGISIHDNENCQRKAID